VKIPRDDRAEREVTGHAIATARGAELAFERLDPADLYDARLRRLLEASRHLADVHRFITPLTDEEIQALWPMSPPSSEHVRIGAAAVIADEVIAYVRQLVGERSTFQDTAGQFPPRVTEAAEKRRAMMALGDALRALQDGASVGDALQVVKAVAA
jgi:hypothetical protein